MLHRHRHRPRLHLRRSWVRARGRRIRAKSRAISVIVFRTTRAIAVKKRDVDRPKIAGHVIADLRMIADPATIVIAHRRRLLRRRLHRSLATIRSRAVPVTTVVRALPARGVPVMTDLGDPVVLAAPATAVRAVPATIPVRDLAPVIDVRRVAALLAALIAVVLLASTRAWAANDQALAHFDEAAAAFEAEEFSKSRALFEMALDEGLQGPAVHYNLGAAAYRGGDLPRAERAFREVARTPAMAALAYYNLGLVALQRRDERDAREWFERAQQAEPDPKISELAARRLSELPEARAPGRWSYYSRGGVGYDDNVSLRSSSLEASSGAADSYGELIFAGSYSFGMWRVDTGGSVIEYFEQDDYSQSSLSLGGARGFRTDNWYFELGAYGAEYSLGGERYERDLTGAFQASRLFHGGSRLRALVRASAVGGRGEFEGLTGERLDVGLYYDRSWRRWTFGAHGRWQRNDSEDPIFASHWAQLGADVRYAVSPLWGLVASAGFRRITHAAESETLPGWDDNRATLLLGVTRMLRSRLQLFVRAQLERNDSPVAGYDYDRNWIAASVEMWR